MDGELRVNMELYKWQQNYIRYLYRAGDWQLICLYCKKEGEDGVLSAELARYEIVEGLRVRSLPSGDISMLSGYPDIAGKSSCVEAR